jgi:hypothetical protein
MCWFLLNLLKQAQHACRSRKPFLHFSAQMPSFGVYVADDDPLLAEIEKRAAAHKGNKSAYARAAMERDIAQAGHQPTSPEIIEELCRVLRPDDVSELSSRLQAAKVNQPKLLGSLMEALVLLFDRESQPTQRLYLLTARETAALAMDAARRQDNDAVALLTRIAPDIADLINEGRIIGLGELMAAEREQAPYPAKSPVVKIAGDPAIREGQQRPESAKPAPPKKGKRAS